jgi:hypothetical protein
VRRFTGVNRPPLSNTRYVTSKAALLTNGLHQRGVQRTITDRKSVGSQGCWHDAFRTH